MDKSSIINAIAEALTKDPFNLEEMNSVKAFVGIKGNAGFLKSGAAALDLLMANHFTLAADLFIYDEKLGSLGLVQVLDKPKSTQKTVSEKVKQWVEKATYAAYLLRNEPKSINKEPISIHLVISTQKDPRLDTYVGAALQEVARETECLQHISVHSLTADTDENWQDIRSFKTAFCWLLRATEKWFNFFENNAKDPAGRKPRAKLSKLVLENYRLSGKRELCFNDQASVHFIHGHNGTGKSTIAEALELIITGKVARLGKEEDYDRIIRNKYSRTKAKIQLTCLGKKPKKLKVEKPKTNYLEPPYGASFRLNNQVMQHLTDSDEKSRSIAFLEAFFPDQRGKVLSYRKDEEKASQNFNRLPDSVRTRIQKSKQSKEHLSEAVVRKLGRFDKDVNPSYGLIEQEKQDLIPFPLQDLKPLSPELKTAIDKWESPTLTAADLDSVLTSLDEALAPIIAEQGVRLEKATEIFKRKLSHFQARNTGGSTENFEEQLNKGLELRGLSKIAESLYTVTATLENAIEAGWRIKDPDVDRVFGEHAGQYPDPARLKQLGDKWAAKSEAILGRLRPSSGKDNGDTAPSEAIPERIKLTGRDIRILNSVGPYLLDDLDESDRHQAESFGKIIDRAIVMDIEQQIGPHSIGRKGWHKHFENRVGILVAAVKNIPEPTGESAGASPCRQHFDRFMEVYETYRKLKTDGESLTAAFNEIMRVGNIYESIHELMAFFAPAGWSFSPIKLQLGAVVIDSNDEPAETNVSGGGRTRRSESEISPLRLNSAELNLFAVALFFLCAHQVNNPDRLLILDDPLQNMDEVTVLTLARGIAKLIRRWFKDWQVLFLFHSENDLVRFSKNIPSAVYRLPWLSPSKKAPPGKGKIPVYTSTLTSGRQGLDGILDSAG